MFIQGIWYQIIQSGLEARKSFFRTNALFTYKDKWAVLLQCIVLYDFQKIFHAHDTKYTTRNFIIWPLDIYKSRYKSGIHKGVCYEDVTNHHQLLVNN